MNNRTFSDTLEKIRQNNEKLHAEFCKQYQEIPTVDVPTILVVFNETIFYLSRLEQRALHFYPYHTTEQVAEDISQVKALRDQLTRLINTIKGGWE